MADIVVPQPLPFQRAALKLAESNATRFIVLNKTGKTHLPRWRTGQVFEASVEFELPPKEMDKLYRSIRKADRANVRKGLRALWLRPIKQKPYGGREWDEYVGYERNRDDEWTLWRAILVTLAILLGRRMHDNDPVQRRRRHLMGNAKLVDGKWVPYPHPHYPETYGMAYWDAGPVYGGYNVECLQLGEGMRYLVFNDGESTM